MNVLAAAGISETGFEKATGEVAGEFKVLDAGVYKATIKEIAIYQNTFGGKTMRYTVNLTEDDRDITFRKDINSHLKDNVENDGYINRFKQFLYAANVKDSECKNKKKAVKINSFGKEYDADIVLGPVGKPILAEVLLMEDTTKTEGEPYHLQNALAGVLAVDGTDASGENKVEAFVEKCKKTPTTKFQGYVKASTTTSGTVNANAAKEAEEEGF